MDALTAIMTPTLLLVLARLLGLVLVAPVLSHAALPVQLRVMIAVVMSLAAVGQVAAPVAAFTDAAMLAALAGELAVGLAMGYAARMALVGVELGAYHVGQQMGVSLADVLDPASDESFDVVRRLYGLLAIVIFLAVGGHRMVISAGIGSFHALPPSAVLSAQAPLLAMLTALLASAFSLAVQVAAPVLITLILAAVAMGFLQKTMPQLNILSVGLSVRVMLGLLAMAASLVVLTPAIQAFLGAMTRQFGLHMPEVAT